MANLDSDSFIEKTIRTLMAFLRLIPVKQRALVLITLILSATAAYCVTHTDVRSIFLDRRHATEPSIPSVDHDSIPTHVRQTEALRGESAAILTPNAEDGGAGRTLIVSGSANLAASHHLWLFAKRKGTTRWWPQGEAEILPNHSWELVVSIGESVDIGKLFEIHALVLDDPTHQRILAQFAKSETLARLPDPLIVATSVTVRKTNHD